MSVEYSFTPSNPISTNNRTSERFEQTDANNNTHNSSFIITDSDFYNSIINFLGNNYEIRTNINVKNYDIVCDDNVGKDFFGYSNQTPLSLKIQTDFIFPIAIYNKLQNYYFILSFGNNYGDPSMSQLYVCIVYPESQKCRTTELRPNSGQREIILYNINKNIFILSDGTTVLENRNDIVFYENYELENLRPNTKDLRNQNGLSISLADTPGTIKTTTTNNLGLCPLYDSNSNKVFEGIYRALQNNYNNEVVRADGISYFVLPMRTGFEGSFANLVISSEIIGAE